MSENLCVTQFGCDGKCCNNSTLYVTQRELAANFDGEKHIIDPEDIFAIKARALAMSMLGLRKVFVAKTESGVSLVQLVGPCPNLDENSYDCLSQQKPRACFTGFPMGGDNCMKIRTKQPGRKAA